MGTPINGDAIYNGALDNASGVASLLEIARTLREGKVKPRRSILFAIVTAEEKGLLGSSYFARRPTVPQKRSEEHTSELQSLMRISYAVFCLKKKKKKKSKYTQT